MGHFIYLFVFCLIVNKLKKIFILKPLFEVSCEALILGPRPGPKTQEQVRVKMALWRVPGRSGGNVIAYFHHLNDATLDSYSWLPSRGPRISL